MSSRLGGCGPRGPPGPPPPPVPRPLPQGPPPPPLPPPPRGPVPHGPPPSLCQIIETDPFRGGEIARRCRVVQPYGRAAPVAAAIERAAGRCCQGVVKPPGRA